MTIWIDAHIAITIAMWITTTFGVQTVAFRDRGLCDATDHEIFMAARRAQAIVMIKDSGVVHLLDRYGTPPHVIWLTCGNTSNANLKVILGATLQQARDLLTGGR
jgi:predicted nuclease of predicted toxin-antitoxin system